MAKAAPVIDRAETEVDPKSVDRAFRRAALIHDAKLSVRRRRLGARRRQGTS